MTQAKPGVAVRFRLVLLFIFGTGLFLSMSLPILADNGWNPTIFVKFPEALPEFLTYGEERLGDVIVAPEAGHDGKFYFVQAMDPLYLDPGNNAYLIDRPTYRAQRMLYPTVAALAGIGGGAQSVVWAMYIINAVGIGLGCVVTGLVAKELGISEYFGLAFAANLGMLYSGLLDTAEVLGFGLLMLGLYFCLRSSWRWMTLALTLSVLAREVMLAGVFGVVAYLVFAGRKVPWHLIWTLLVPAAWFGYLQLRIGYLPGYDDHAPVLDLPLAGFFKAVQSSMSQPGQTENMIVSILLMLIAIVFLVRVLRGNRDLVNTVGASFALVAITMAEVVWLKRFDSTRALAPLMTLYILSIPLLNRDRTNSTGVATSVEEMV